LRKTDHFPTADREAVKRLRLLRCGETVPKPAGSHFALAAKTARNLVSRLVVDQTTGLIMWTLLSLIYRISCRTTLLAMRRYRLTPMF
jgi:hypothetical protein